MFLHAHGSLLSPPPPFYCVGGAGNVGMPPLSILRSDLVQYCGLRAFISALVGARRRDEEEGKGAERSGVGGGCG